MLQNADRNFFPKRVQSSTPNITQQQWRLSHLVLMVEESVDTHSGVCVPNLHTLI